MQFVGAAVAAVVLAWLLNEDEVEAIAAEAVE